MFKFRTQKMTIWEFILNNLILGKPCMLLQVAQSLGSSPGRQGFKMAVSIDGTLQGSIGGGIMEHKLVTLALRLLEKGSKDILCKQQVHNKSNKHNQSGMICSGEQTIILLPLSESELPIIKTIANSMQQVNENYFQINKDGIELKTNLLESPPFIVSNLHSENWLYAEKLHHKKVVHIIGGGHVGLAFSKQMALLGFHVCIYDNRPELNTLLNNVDANEKHIIDYSKIDHYIPEGDQHLVVIMSFGYRDDKLVLKALYQKQFGYIGMMGSKAKIKQLFEELEAEGIGADQMAHVHTPIGLKIGSKTPAEIAVSIAAEIIGVLNA